jgi:antitoxin component of RelBE/YafQ-DinJ toxin-antitoxin module
MARPTVAIRIDADLYDDLLEIADRRDCTITQALNIYMDRKARQTPMETDILAETKPEPKPKPKVKKKRGRQTANMPVCTKCGIRIVKSKDPYAITGKKYAGGPGKLLCANCMPK